MNKDINSDYLRGHIDTIILKSLFDGEKYGYEICKDIETKSGGSFILKQPSLYSALKRLEASGLISSRWQDSEIGGKRHYYSLTDEGIKHYEDSQAEWNYSYNILHNLISEGKDQDVNKAEPSTSLSENSLVEPEHKNDAELISNENTTEEIPSVDFVSPDTNQEDSILSGQLNFLPEDKQQFVEPEKVESDMPAEQLTSQEKNDAEFIKDTIIDDENDVSFSNNVYFRVKNEIKKVNENKQQRVATPSVFSAFPTNSASEVNGADKSVNSLEQKQFNFNNYEIKPYNKYNKHGKKTEFIKKNKFFFMISLITSLLMLVEVLGFSLIYNFAGLETVLTKPFLIAYGICALSMLIFTLINLVIYPQKKGTIRIKNRYVIKLVVCSLFIAAICVINIVLNHKIFIEKQAFTTILIPSVFVLNLIVEELVYNLFKNNKKFKA